MLMSKRRHYEPAFLREALATRSAWAREHWGECARIARQLGLSRGFVNRVLRGERFNEGAARTLDTAMYGGNRRRRVA